MQNPVRSFLVLMFQILFFSAASHADQSVESTVYITVNLQPDTANIGERTIIDTRCLAPAEHVSEQSQPATCQDTNNTYEWTEKADTRVVLVKPI